MSEPNNPGNPKPKSALNALNEPAEIQWSSYKKFGEEMVFMGFDPMKNEYYGACSDPRFVFMKGTAQGVMKQIDTTIELYEAYMKEKTNANNVTTKTSD